MNEPIKRIGTTLLAATFGTGMALIGVSPASAASAARKTTAITARRVQVTTGDTAAATQSVMVVQGNGEVSVTPDIVRVSVGISTQNADASKAAQENAVKTDAVVRALKSAGVSEKDIRTSGYNIYRNEERTMGGGGFGGGGGDVSGNGQIVGGKAGITYIVSNNITATVRKVSDAGRVLDAAVKAGANVAGGNFGGGGGIAFAVDNPVPAREKALKLAVANAQSKARALAEAAGLDAFYLIRIEESGGDYAPTRGGAEGFAARAAVSTPILPGEQTVSASVTITYSITPKLIPLQP